MAVVQIMTSPVDIDGGDVAGGQPDEINGGTASQTGLDPVSTTTTTVPRRPRFNSNLARGTSVAKYGKIIASVPDIHKCC